MAKSDSPVKQALPGWIIGKSDYAEIDEIMAAPPEDQDRLFEELWARHDAEARAEALDRMDRLYARIEFGHIDKDAIK
jgi:hypothetical protein